ncbi:Sensor protein RstB [Raoultella terrigena]|uniref:Sensor protein RstB n=1 Tax=Raoultella terrigena TaxID=577 RepID=A0A4U9CU31_RAOTE|nr:Sensor protein RstB [Raoultella terrigena]
MKKLFVQFYLLLFVCFLVMTMLVGLVYKFTAERAGRQSLDDLMKSSLYLMRSELRENSAARLEQNAQRAGPQPVVRSAY